MPLSQENRMQIAISAYKIQKIKSKLKAAEVFSVSKATLHYQLKGTKARIKTHTNGHKLTAIKEEVLIKRVLDADK